MATFTENPPVGEYIVEADWVLACENDTPRLVQNASVHVVGDRIEMVSDSAIRGDCPRVRARGQLLMPGFISGHTHACSATPTRGIIETGRSFARPYELVEEWSDEALDHLTAFNVAELLRSGCTTHVEMSLSPKQARSYVRIAREWAVRAYPGGMIPGPDRWASVWFSASDQPLLDSEPETLAEIEEYREYALGINHADDDRIRPMMMPHATDTHTPTTLLKSLEVAKELGNGIHIHLAQSPDEVARVERLWGKRPVEWLDELGLFSERVFGAHLWHVDLVDDPPILTRSGKFTYAHCPSSLGAGGSNGTQPWPELLAAGVNTSIGVDTHSNDYVENIKVAVLNGRARYFLLHEQSEVPMVIPTPWDAVNAATINAAQGLGRSDLGRIEPGAKADFCTIELNGFLVGVGATPPEPLNNLLYANGLSVRHVATDGTFQIWDGHLIADDEQRVLDEGGEVVAALWRQLDDEGWFEGEPSHPEGWPYTWKSANVVADV